MKELHRGGEKVSLGEGKGRPQKYELELQSQWKPGVFLTGIYFKEQRKEPRNKPAYQQSIDSRQRFRKLPWLKESPVCNADDDLIFITISFLFLYFFKK